MRITFRCLYEHLKNNIKIKKFKLQKLRSFSTCTHLHKIEIITRIRSYSTIPIQIAKNNICSALLCSKIILCKHTFPNSSSVNSIYLLLRMFYPLN